MKKLFYAFCFLGLFLSLLVLLGTVNRELGQKLLFRETTDEYLPGDLYAFCLLSDFEEYYKIFPELPEGTVETAEIITFGDSFFGSQASAPLFAKMLEDSTGILTYNSGTGMKEERDNSPIQYLRSVDFKKGERRFLILEQVERYVIADTERIFLEEAELVALKHRPKRRQKFAAVFNEWVEEHLLVLKGADADHLFRRSLLTYPVSKLIANLRFRLLDETDKNIFAYSLSPKMLFYAYDKKFFDKRHLDLSLELSAIILAQMSQQLKEEFNLELIYVIIPNKYSIYNDLVNGTYHYNDFIPRFNAQLRLRGVYYIDLYSIFRNYRAEDNEGLLYFPGDTHFSPIGKELLVQAVGEVIEKLKE